MIPNFLRFSLFHTETLSRTQSPIVYQLALALTQTSTTNSKISESEAIQTLTGDNELATQTSSMGSKIGEIKGVEENVE